MATKPTIAASTLLSLLAARHADDVFVPECKDGPSQGTSHLRMDAWAMLRSWSNPLTFAYEIKVTRSDFTRDDKWHSYLPYCSEFYFVCPQGLIKPDELPPEAGLLYASSTGTRLFTKKKPVRRQVEIPESVWRYIVMCRAKIARPNESVERPTARELCRKWLEEKAEDRQLGYLVGRAVQEKVNDVERDNLALQQQMKQYDDIRNFLKSLDIDPAGYVYASTVRARMKDICHTLPPGLLRSLEWAKDNLNAAIENLSQLEPKAGVQEVA